MSDTRCPYCTEEKDFKKGKEIVGDRDSHTFLHIQEKELYIEVTQGEDIIHSAKFPIKYCPLCGKRIKYKK